MYIYSRLPVHGIARQIMVRKEIDIPGGKYIYRRCLTSFLYLSINDLEPLIRKKKVKHPFLFKSLKSLNYEGVDFGGIPTRGW